MESYTGMVLGSWLRGTEVILFLIYHSVLSNLESGLVTFSLICVLFQDAFRPEAVAGAAAVRLLGQAAATGGGRGSGARVGLSGGAGDSSELSCRMARLHRLR